MSDTDQEVLAEMVSQVPEMAKAGAALEEKAEEALDAEEESRLLLQRLALDNNCYQRM